MRFLIRAFLCLSILLLLYSPSFALYTVYLKNGSVIRGVEGYERAGGEIKLVLPAGVVGVPEKDILKIERAGKGLPAGEKEEALAPAPDVPDVPDVPEAKPAKPAKPAEKRMSPEKEKQIADLRRRIEEIDGRVAEIGRKDEEAKSLDTELNGVNFRIEVLFQKGIKNARAAGAPDTQWFLYISEQEREWSKVNLMRQKELKTKIEQAGVERKEHEKDLKYLTTERQSLENQIRSLEQQPR